mmetsp:Transcript_19976/g.43237  ORF Transcript_19976/g.43237 Transcript_19976/m.43237 type:complete len:223 (+) Transcript_19976:205-873(+)
MCISEYSTLGGNSMGLASATITTEELGATISPSSGARMWMPKLSSLAAGTRRLGSMAWRKAGATPCASTSASPSSLIVRDVPSKSRKITPFVSIVARDGSWARARHSQPSTGGRPSLGRSVEWESTARSSFARLSGRPIMPKVLGERDVLSTVQRQDRSEHRGEGVAARRTEGEPSSSNLSKTRLGSAMTSKSSVSVETTRSSLVHSRPSISWRSKRSFEPR